MTLQQVDSLCDEFEAALREGNTVRIEDFLPKIDDSLRTKLLHELLEVELQFASERSENDADEPLRTTLESLKNRFPEDCAFIENIFRRLARLQQIGDYVIIQELGRGGMGIVYKAKHKLLQQFAAVKVLSKALLDDSQAVGRFHREIQLIGGLTHPNIVRALNAGEIDGVHYLAMEFVDGITLQKLTENVWNANKKALPVIPVGAACEAIRQAAIGLQNVHEYKLVHRDIKPANLMLDYRGTVKILDLGLGKFAEEHRTDDYNDGLTIEGMVLGTVDYIAPEQCENSGEADIRSDMYSLGCSLFFLLTGKPVYSGSQYNTIRKKLMAHIVGDIPSLKQTIPSIPNELEAVLHKVLAKDPAERYQTPLEFAEALAPLASFDELWNLMLDVMPASADTPSSFRHSNSPYASLYTTKRDIPKPASRFKWIQLLVFLHVLVFGGALGTAVYFVKQHSREARQAEVNLVTQREMAEELESDAKEYWNQWNMQAALSLYQKSISIRARLHLAINDSTTRRALALNRINNAMTLWYLGNSRGAGGATSELESVLGTINKRLETDEQPDSELNTLKMFVLEHLADFTLFGGAASGRFTERIIANRILQYNDAAKAGASVVLSNSDDEIRTAICVIRWKQAILLAMQKDVKQAQTLLEQNPLSDNADLHTKLVHQLAEAILFYYQTDNQEERNLKLRVLRTQFSLQGQARELMTQPEILELLMFCAEFLIYDSIKHEDWETLYEDISIFTIANALFLQDYRHGIYFMRRFYDLTIQTAVLLFEKLERPQDRQRLIENIVLMLDRIRSVENRDSIGMSRTTLVFFFLPDASNPATGEPLEGSVIVSPRDGREGDIFALPLTRQKVKLIRPAEGQLPSSQTLPAPLLERIEEEKKLGNKIHVSWDDSAVWSRPENALTESDYPFGDLLPLR